ncbi:endonuclease domain-containing protein [Modestobacter roseus]|uniref:endonuclease domain-containing protein n=1 Tax=Modestobacter roseus TaxID=1181884 RepID=UPI0034DF8C28
MPRRRRPSELPGPSTRAGALARGVSDWRLRHPDVVRLSRDTYLPRGDAADLRSRLPAVLLTAPAGAVVSHHTAAAMWRVEIPLAAASSVAHLTVPPRSKARNRADRHLHRTPLSPEDVERRWGMPVTSPARTWRDLAAELAPAALLAVTDQLLDVLCRPAELEEALRRRPTGHGAARARRVLAVADPRVDSPMESVTRWLLHEAGLPRPTLQYRVVDEHGRRIGFGDMAWPERKVLVEFDGNVHRERDVFVDDLRRQNRLVLAGWVVLRFTSADVLGRPHEVVTAVRRALAR